MGGGHGEADHREPQCLPEGFAPADWPNWTDGYAVQSNGDWGGCYHERGEIFDTVRDHGITGFAILAGDLHSFWAGYASKSLPPHGRFEPVGLSFVGGSITSPGMQEAYIDRSITPTGHKSPSRFFRSRLLQLRAVAGAPRPHATPGSAAARHPVRRHVRP